MESLIRKLVLKIVPRAVAEDMEAHSRTWMLRCPCGHERSVWDIGGIRWKAVGNSKNLLRCPSCGKLTWHTMYRRLPE